jgi:AraC family transcriptional regulator, transcriptional activator of pobA
VPIGLPLEVRRLSDDRALIAGREDPGHFSLVFVKSGRGRFVVDRSTFDFGPGALLLGSPGQRHAGTRLSDVDGWSAIFQPAALDPLVSADRGHGLVVPLPGDPRWAAYSRPRSPAHLPQVEATDRPLWDLRFHLLRRELVAPVARPGSVQLCRAYLTTLLVDATRLARRQLVGSTETVDPLLVEVSEVIERGYTGTLSLDDVARSLARSPRHLSRQVKERSGRTVIELITERRLMEARRLLANTNATIEQIAKRVGYEDVGNFRRRFRQTHGMSPHEWRSSNTD